MLVDKLNNMPGDPCNKDGWKPDTLLEVDPSNNVRKEVRVYPGINGLPVAGDNPDQINAFKVMYKERFNVIYMVVGSNSFFHKTGANQWTPFRFAAQVLSCNDRVQGKMTAQRDAINNKPKLEWCGGAVTWMQVDAWMREILAGARKLVSFGNLACDPGYYNSDTSLQRGTDNTQHSACAACPAGRYAFKGQILCTGCPRGMFADETTSTNCQGCAAGKYSGAAGSANCQDCAAGKYSGAAGSANCQDCAAGKYSGAAGSANCQDCAAGKYSGDTGSISAANCKNCAAGKYSDATGSANCQDCVAGKYTDNSCYRGNDCCPGRETNLRHNNQFCSHIIDQKACLNSYFTNGAGIAIKCKWEGGQCTKDVECAFTPGTAAPTSSPANCQDCAAGKYSGAAGSANCQDCAAGKYSGTTGSANCQDCAAGKYSDATGSISAANCQDCAAGKYSGAAGSANCQDCAAGKYSGATGSISAANCQDCAAGKYSDATGSTSAANCQDQSADVVAAAEAATSGVVIAVDGSSNGGT